MYCIEIQFYDPDRCLRKLIEAAHIHRQKFVATKDAAKSNTIVMMSDNCLRRKM